MNGRWYDESAENVTVHPDERAETSSLEKGKVIAADGSGCAWMAPNVPPIVLLEAAAAGFTIVGGFLLPS